MTEIRCVKCKRLLMKAEFVKAQIKCPKCGYLDYVLVDINKEGYRNISEVFEPLVNLHIKKQKLEIEEAIKQKSSIRI